MPRDSRAPRGAILVAALCVLAACRTTYTIPDADSAAEQSGASLSFWARTRRMKNAWRRSSPPRRRSTAAWA